METITKEQYLDQLSAYITERMASLPEGRRILSEWADFNRDMKDQFDAQLAANGVSVVE